MNFRTPEIADVEVNLTPLIDVVFLLLIFFMVTTTFEQEAKIKIDLPTATSSYPEAQDNILELIIDSEGRYYLDKKEVINSKPETLFRAMTETLNQRKEKPSLIISSDANAGYQSVITAMDIAGRVGLTNFSLATSQSERKK